MSYPNLIRLFISLLLSALVVISIAGWVWAGGQASPAMEGSRFALTLSGVGAAAGLVLLWGASVPRPNAR